MGEEVVQDPASCSSALRSVVRRPVPGRPGRLVYAVCFACGLQVRGHSWGVLCVCECDPALGRPTSLPGISLLSHRDLATQLYLARLLGAQQVSECLRAIVCLPEGRPEGSARSAGADEVAL